MQSRPKIQNLTRQQNKAPAEIPASAGTEKTKWNAISSAYFSKHSQNPSLAALPEAIGRILSSPKGSCGDFALKFDRVNYVEVVTIFSWRLKIQERREIREASDS
ncbi:hypothetical protein V6N11_033943 [Hibiscus sabdariffa]|uniref:Uncharacterized protein n=1 Tax=Hibiscus sabdariffa TaxID=183260 RepID=A0ABR2S115_9ROSI